MKKYAPLIALAAVVIVVGVAVVLMGGNDNPETSNNSNPTPPPAQTTTPPGSTAVATNEVEIEDFAYRAAEITIKRGTTVTWTNKDSTAHTVTADSGEGPDSAMLGRGDSYSYTFNTVGEFSYHCTPHPDMKGKVIVTE